MEVIKDIPKGEHYVLVKLSGGADSSIVYYAVCDKFKNRDDVNIIVVTLDTDLKNQYIKSAQRIVGIVKELTGKSPYTHLTRTVPHSDQNYIDGQDKLVNIAKSHYNIYRMYSGITINPPVEDLTRYVKKHHERHGFDLQSALNSIATRDTTRDIASKVRHKEFDQSGFLFKYGDKRLVADLYKRYNMMEKLYPYTFSCETSDYTFDYWNNPQHCGHCFFCLERWWAFGRII